MHHSAHPRSSTTALGLPGRARRRRKPLTVLAVLLGLCGVFLAVPASAEGPSRSSAGDAPAEATTGVAVFDRQTGSFTEATNENAQFRSASVVKLLLALDFLWDRGPDYGIPAEDRTRLQAMLRSSDDDEAGHYWSQLGGSASIDRMVARLGLTGTAPPPADYPGYWGYTALTAADTVRIYRYILDTAPAPVRDFLMDNLRQATHCASDGYDQYFGIPSAFERPWAVKQGWSGFTSGGCTDDKENTAESYASAPDEGPGAKRPEAGEGAVDLVADALHSTGVVGPGDRSIVAVFTLHPDGTPYESAYAALTQLVGSLDVPGAVRPAGSRHGG